MNDQDEMFEAATETPVSLGCPSLVPPQVIAHDEPARESRSREEVEEQRRRETEHFSFCNGLFPIHTVRTPTGCMGKCEINGRTFSFSSVDASGPDDHACTVRIWDGDNQIAFMSVLRGRSMAEPIAMGAFKAYVKRLSGSNKFHGRGGFLKQAVARAKEKGEAKTCGLKCRNAFSRQTQSRCDGSCAKMWSTPKLRRDCSRLQDKLLGVCRKIRGGRRSPDASTSIS